MRKQLVGHKMSLKINRVRKLRGKKQIKIHKDDMYKNERVGNFLYSDDTPQGVIGEITRQYYDWVE